MSIGPQVERASPNRDFRDIFERIEKLERIAARQSAIGDCCVTVELFSNPPDYTGLGSLGSGDSVTDTADESSDWLLHGLNGYDDYSDTGYVASTDFKTIGVPFVPNAVYLVQVWVAVPQDPTPGLQADDARKQWALEVNAATAADIDSFGDLVSSPVEPGAAVNTFGRAHADYDLQPVSGMAYEFIWRHGMFGDAVQGLQFILHQTHPGGDHDLRQTAITSNVWIARLHAGP